MNAHRTWKSSVGTPTQTLKEREHFLRRLKWSAIILPALFALWSETLRHQFFDDTPVLLGNLITASLALFSAYVVAVVIFHYIDWLDADLLAQNHRLAALNALAAIAHAPTDEADLISRSLPLIRDALGVREALFAPESLSLTDGDTVPHLISYGDAALGALIIRGVPVDLDRSLLVALGDSFASAIANRRLRAENERVLLLEERDRIARELHDGLAQMLAAITFQSEQARAALADGYPAAARIAIERIEAASSSAYADVREAIVGLREGMTRDFMTALVETADRFEDTTGIHTTVSGRLITAHLVPSADLHLLRVIQECLTNVRKHSQATSVTIAVRDEDGTIAVAVQDNGVGFDPARIPREGRQHFGLVIMQERVASLRGHLTVQSRRGEGTTVRVTVPTRPTEARGAA